MAKTFVTMFQENEELTQDFMRSKLKSLIPMFLATVNGHFDVSCDSKAIADFMQMPEAQALQTNVHDLLTSKSAWATIDNLELIKQALDEDDEY